MPNYDERREVAAVDLAAHGSASDDDNIAAVCIVPAGKTVSIYGLEAFITTGSGASDTIEVVLSSAATTVLAEVDINSTGVNKDTSTTFPVRVANTTSSDAALLFRANGATGSPIGTVFCQYSNPGVA